MTRKALALLAIAVAIVGVTGLFHSAPAEAQSHRAFRTFSAAWVLPGGELNVTITATGYGAFGQVVETLPVGFSYEDSNLASPTAVEVEGQAVTFILLGEESFTYTVTAPTEANMYAFSGVMLDFNKSETTVTGHTAIRVGPEPTPTPTPEPTPTATSTATPTSTPEPTATATPEPTATLTPTVAPELTPTPAPTPATVEPEQGGGAPIALLVLVGIGALLALGALAAYVRRRRQ